MLLPVPQSLFVLLLRTVSSTVATCIVLSLCNDPSVSRQSLTLKGSLLVPLSVLRDATVILARLAILRLQLCYFQAFSFSFRDRKHGARSTTKSSGTPQSSKPTEPEKMGKLFKHNFCRSYVPRVSTVLCTSFSSKFAFPQTPSELVNPRPYITAFAPLAVKTQAP